ncbi:MAG: hypothetical protein JO276_02930 [Sphingomonadaceae bacterium]|nr:hypothetical protein [Sphingomonadaceae bacterium]
MIRANAFVLAFAMVASGAPARRAPAPAPPEEEAICVGGPEWRATLLDARQIEVAPVPAGYRALFETRDPCLEQATNETILVEWHLRFGSEASTTAALAYVERDYSQQAQLIADYRSRVESAWRAAQPDLRAAHEVRQPEHVNYSAQAMFVERSRTIGRLQALVAVRENFIFLALLYLRAAEEFGSLPMLDKAAIYLRPALDGAAFLAPLERQPPVANMIYFNLQTFRTDEIRMREAVLRAHLTRTPQDLARAEQVLQSIEQPLYRRLAEAAYSGDDFCDIDRGASGADELETACAADDEISQRVAPYWVNRAMLGFVLPPSQSRDGELALRLLEQERFHQGHCCLGRTEDDLVRFYRMQADQQRHAFTEAVARRDWFAARQPWSQALDALEKAVRLTPPDQAPARFRRIARAWLDIWVRSSESRGDPDESVAQLTEAPQRRRFASYLRQTLAGLDRIATGTDAGSGPQAD